MQETSNVYTNAPMKGLTTDLHENLVSKEFWTFARNAQTNSHLGQIQFLQNEPSNYRCVDLPYIPIGFIKLLRNRWFVCMTDDVDSEIGIFDESNCTYTKIANDKCLAFRKAHLVQGVSKENEDCSESVYFTDSINHRRKITLSAIPYKYEIGTDRCETKIFGDELDCDSIRLNMKVTVPSIGVKPTSSGNLKNGVYQFAIAYGAKGLRITDFYSVTTPQSIWTHRNAGSSIVVNIKDLDRDFTEYELVGIYTVDGVTRYMSLGYFPTHVESHTISSMDRAEYTELTLADIIIKRPVYPYADIVAANDQYLLWAGMRTDREINYQKQAMKIRSEYVVYQVPEDYYAKGGTLVGYNRDEIYAFGIQWLKSSGDWTPVYHIPGRKARGDKANGSGPDAYELSMEDCHHKRLYKFQVENTASKMAIEDNNFLCGERIIGFGNMAYWEIENQYPDNRTIYGTDACTPIRHHRMPDNCKTHIHSNSGKNINILGVRFNNIEHPKDEYGQKIPDIVGYRIVRGNREGNRTVVANGICTNMRAYRDKGQTILYPNYPVNDLRPDNFLSSSKVYSNRSGNERGYSPLTEFRTNQFSFYSPHTLISNISLGEEIKFLMEEWGPSVGQFEYANKHPKQKILTQFDFYFALIVGAIDGFLSTLGKKTYIRNKSTVPGIHYQTADALGGEIMTTDNRYQVMAVDSVINGINNPGLDGIPSKIIYNALKVLAGAGIFAFFALKAAHETLEVLYNFSGWQQYALQYNSHTLFTNSRCTPAGNTRRRIEHYQYISDGINTVEDTKLNNYKRAESVYIRTNASITVPVAQDTSRNTISQLGICDDVFRRVTRTGSAYYTSIKRTVANQYGQIDSIEYLDTGAGVLPLTLAEEERTYKTPAIFGGDTYINKFSVKDSFHYFSQYLYDVPDGYIYDYDEHRNVGYPRFWINTIPYDFSQIINRRPSESILPNAKHNLDCQGNNRFKGIGVVKDRYFYLHNNSVKEFFVESDYNLDYRDWKGQKQEFYSRSNQNLSELFKSGEDIEKPEEFIYDKTYSKQLIENSLPAQSRDFDPEVDKTCYSYKKNLVIYSLPNIQGKKGDNWIVNLSNNYYQFASNEVGNLVSIHPIDNQQFLFLFDEASPYISAGRDILQLDGSGRKITLGDGGLFAQEPRPVAHTDYGYGASQSKWNFVDTHFGAFYTSQKHGRIMKYGEGLEDVSRSGMYHWFKEYMPSKLLEDFPTYFNTDNTVSGIGMRSIFDPTNEIYYIIKKDYKLKDEFKGVISYDEKKKLLLKDGFKVELEDEKYFDDASWTVSYSPKDKHFISWHDWHPHYLLQSDKHFLSVRHKSIWKHNDNYESFCTFYDRQYPFSVEYLVNNGMNTNILRSIEYHLEVGQYMNNGNDFHHILDENFDMLTIYNSEQISGYLKMILQKKNDVSAMFEYPKLDESRNEISILYNKEEQKYRVNQFWNILNDRGEFTGMHYPMWITEPNGYIKTINPAAVNYKKKDGERAKFRHVWHKVRLTKLKSGNKKYIFKLSNNKQLTSFR